MDERKSSPPEGEVHEYDGIIEEDNQLPRWWLGTFYGAILFAAIYWTAYEGLKAAPSPVQSYRNEVAAVASAEAAKALAAGAVTNESLLSLSRDKSTVEQGKDTFQKLCAACHGPNGGGGFGPNLTDSYWLHGAAPESIYKTVRDGYLQKGMPAWGPQLGEEKVRSVVGYVLTIRGSNVAGGKSPQGELVN
jgi:cytochrome c oxidase cbb3-type subunit 3